MLKLRLPSSLPPPRMGTLKGLCCTPHTVLDLQKRHRSEDNRKKWKTGRDKLTTFHKYNIFLYAATSLVFAATPRSKHPCGPQHPFQQHSAKQLTPLTNVRSNPRALSD